MDDIAGRTPGNEALGAAGSPSNVSALVSTHAATRAGHEALVEWVSGERRALTWSELEDRVVAAAAGLAGLGLVAGQRLGLSGPTSSELVVAYLAGLRAGLVLVPLDAGGPESERAELLAECGVHLLLSADGDGAYPGVRTVPLAALQQPGTGHPPIVSPADPEALAALLTTAGTSGPPKIVMVSHRALLAHLRHVAAADLVDADETALAVVPLFHVFGLGAVLGSWLGSGARLVVADAYADVDLPTLIEQEQVTNLPLTPSLLYRLSQADGLRERLASVRRVWSAAAPLPWRLSQDFTARTGLRVDQAYGLTEACPGVSVTTGEVVGPAHVGQALPGVEIRIGPGSDPGEPGPIWVRGDNLFSGYWPDGVGGPDADGWFDTGDVGYLTGSELFLVDRTRELIVVNGFTVYPTEVEQVIREMPQIRAVAAVGAPDRAAGQRVVVFVAGTDLEPAAVEEHCRRRLAPFKRPREVRVVDDLPRGVTGKVRRAELRRQVLNAEGPRRDRRRPRNPAGRRIGSWC